MLTIKLVKMFIKKQAITKKNDWKIWYLRKGLRFVFVIAQNISHTNPTMPIVTYVADAISLSSNDAEFEFE